MTADIESSRASQPVPARWAPGTHILWRYRANGLSHHHICRPVTVIEDSPRLLAVWMAGGTVCVKPQLADGTPIHHQPLATRYTKPRVTVRSHWHGTGVVKLARPGDPWSIWLFWERGWRFKNWYVNLEEPLTRWYGGVDSEDHFLDLEVFPDRSWRWRDEDEFEQAQLVGLLSAEQAERVREAGRSALAMVREWGSPFTDGWERWRPDPCWSLPSLPHDWDLRHPACTP